jgi:hypothetical protein
MKPWVVCLNVVSLMMFELATLVMFFSHNPAVHPVWPLGAAACACDLYAVIAGILALAQKKS